MGHYVITMTRQFGSLGRPIARELAEILDIEFYDRDIVEATARKTGMSVSEVSDFEETAHKGFLYMGYPLGVGKMEKRDAIFQKQVEIIRNLAEGPSCIIVGRCADYILRDRRDCMHTYIYSTYENRVKNCTQSLGMEEEEARKMIAKVDKARDEYHKRYAGNLPGDINYKDLMMDSTFLGIEGTAEALAGIIKQRFHLL